MESTTPPSVRTTKRKFEDAIRTLDGAIVASSFAAATERPTPSKRPHLARSVYSTLAKLGVTSKEQSQPLPRLVRHNRDVTPPKSSCASPSSTSIADVSKGTPHLTAILERYASKQAPSNLISTPPVRPASEYRPSSTDSFLSRLATYKISTYANKPQQINAVTAARCGWINDGKDRLVCRMCDVSWVLASREGMTKDAASTLIEKQHASLVKMHKDGCPWRARQCDPSVYRVPLRTPAEMVRELRAIALSLEPILANVAVKHPLTPSQLTSLCSIFSAATLERRSSERHSVMDVDETLHHTVPSDIAIVVALFGWVPLATTTRSELRRTPSFLISPAGSYGPSASAPPTRSLSRASSVSNRFREPANITPSASPPRSISWFNVSPDIAGTVERARSALSDNTTAPLPRDGCLVHCVLCQRRVGLWAYSRAEVATTLFPGEASASTSCRHQKEFDLVKEHRSYCPYAARSSVVPSFSQSPIAGSLGNAVEGWRAVLTVVQRYELGQRRRLSRFVPRDDPDSQAPSAELKGVEAMVAGVKINGGRELLRYVKGILG